MKVTVPDGKKGPWSIESFTMTKEQSESTGLRAMIKGDPNLFCPPGDYKRLVHAKRGIVMSNTLMEVESNKEFVEEAHGEVLIHGLGLGMVLEAVLAKPTVRHVTVIELDQDIIDLVAPHFYSEFNLNTLTIKKGDALKHKPKKGDFYHAIWHDIWDDISPENLTDMVKLRDRWAPYAGWQGFWSEGMVRRHIAEVWPPATFAPLNYLAELDRAAHQAHLRRKRDAKNRTKPVSNVQERT
jgi:hypothetical protein